MGNLMANELGLTVNARNWRIALGGYAKALNNDWRKKKVRVVVKNWGKTSLPHRISIHWDCFNLAKVVNFSEWDFVLYLQTAGVRERWTSRDDLKLLSKQEGLVNASTYLMHLESHYERRKAEWPQWLKLLRGFYTGKMKRIDEYLVSSHAKRESTWKWLKRKYDTVESVQEALANKKYSKSYRDLLRRLETYHKNTEDCLKTPYQKP